MKTCGKCAEFSLLRGSNNTGYCGIHKKIVNRTDEACTARASKGNKFNAKSCKYDGFTFDSLMERDYYKDVLLLLKLAGVIKHIDVHPVVTLPGSIRWELDFCVWYTSGKIEYVDVKGREMEKFKDRCKLFDSYHPAAPLVIIKKRGKAFVRE